MRGVPRKNVLKRCATATSPAYKPGMEDSTSTHQHHSVTGRQLTRRNIEAAIAKATMPVRFVDCDMEGVDLSHLDLSGFSFERCTIIDADLRHAKATGTRWTSCRARKAMLCGIDLTDAHLQGGDWNNSDWTASKIAGARFVGLKLTGATFVNSRSLGAVFEDCLMRSCDLRGLSFRKAKLGRCDMSHANVCEVDFRGASLDEGSSLAGAKMDGARFDQADLRSTDISGIGADRVSTLRGARISIAQAAAIIAGSGVKVG